MKPIIEARNLSKKYNIGERQRYLSLRDSVSNIFSSKNTEGPPFWALDDVSFDIHAGESIGIIGRNGAGKSTLLKILSRITPPTKGSVILRGRIASLLEVGTGFHSELTGRENVFMNGSILGLKKREIEAKFDEIVDFSGVEQFIDTPLKHYSSGMQLRLAFAVAAHLEPEILVIDEVLAVGDAEFQKRCLGKMNEVSRSGRTVLFVSHNLGAIQELCPTSIYLNKGKIIAKGYTNAIINTYLNSENQLTKEHFEVDVTKKISFNSIEILNENLKIQSSFSTDEKIIIRINVSSKSMVKGTDFLFFIRLDDTGKRLFIIEKNIADIFSPSDLEQTKMILITIENSFLMPGEYHCEMGFLSSINEYLDRKDFVGNFQIVYGNTPLSKYGDRALGTVFPRYKMEIE
jgi:lipopolysaccharide transport system ATP-binding protein